MNLHLPTPPPFALGGSSPLPNPIPGSQDGVPLNECHADSLIAVVDQEVALFQGTVMENIKLGDAKATIEQVCDLSCAGGCGA